MFGAAEMVLTGYVMGTLRRSDPSEFAGDESQMLEMLLDGLAPRSLDARLGDDRSPTTRPPLAPSPSRSPLLSMTQVARSPLLVDRQLRGKALLRSGFVETVALAQAPDLDVRRGVDDQHAFGNIESRAFSNSSGMSTTTSGASLARPAAMRCCSTR